MSSLYNINTSAHLCEGGPRGRGEGVVGQVGDVGPRDGEHGGRLLGGRAEAGQQRPEVRPAALQRGGGRPPAPWHQPSLAVAVINCRRRFKISSLNISGSHFILVPLVQLSAVCVPCARVPPQVVDGIWR